MREEVAHRVRDELEASGYEPRLHVPDEEGRPFLIRLKGHGFDLGDFKTLVRISEDLGVGMKLDDEGLDHPRRRFLGTTN